MRMLRALGVALALLGVTVVVANTFVAPAHAEDDRKDK
jgi:hypothetical protein